MHDSNLHKSGPEVTISKIFQPLISDVKLVRRIRPLENNKQFLLLETKLTRVTLMQIRPTGGLKVSQSHPYCSSSNPVTLQLRFGKCADFLMTD